MRRLLPALGAAALLGACAQMPQDADRRGDPDCPAAASEFGAARGYFAHAARLGLTPDAYAAGLAQLGDDTARDTRLLGDLRAQDQALDRLSASYGALKTCHGDNIAAWNAARAAGTMTDAELAQRIAAQQQAGTRQWAEAQTALNQSADLDATYLAVAGTRTGGMATGMGAAPFVARGETPIQDKPGTAGATLALLRKGQRVLSSAGGAAEGGWTAIDLNDGSIGYVSAAMLRPVTPNASERLAAANAFAGGGLKADLARESRLALPQKQAALGVLFADMPLPDTGAPAAPRSVAAQASTGAAMPPQP